jgi:hypothetical protein
MHVQEILHFRGKRQSEVAAAIGYSSGHFSHICQGKKPMPLDKVGPLADFIKADPGDVAKAFIAVRESYERGEQRGE